MSFTLSSIITLMDFIRLLFGTLALFSFLAFLILYLKYYEKKGIYFPVRKIHLTPKEIGLEFEDVYFFSSDGVKLNGWYIPAKETRATVLFCHGNAGNISHRIDVIYLFYKLGLSVFIFDYRGYGRSQGRPTEEGLYLDAEAAHKYLIKSRNLNEGSIVVYGKSIGANVAVELCSKVKIAALISESAFTSALEMGKKLFPFLPLKWIISIKFDALSKIKNITVPKLIIHSEDDKIIPFRHGRKLFEAALEPKEFYPMRGGHNDAIFLASEDFVSKIDAFIQKHLN
ncbi:MAG TPA: alpha/beta hydrolase [Candidatus Aminicenantes bacterium]|nr:alpha/beta hydrolase [Candidatus Aminicenantes bacterium]HEB34908.1 alpha/beta hydrolase [Candidatus Aminicenantes bacterium]